MQNKTEKVIVIGAGGHSRSVCDILLQNPCYEIIGLLDFPDKTGFFDLPVIGDDSKASALFIEGRASLAFVALGDNGLRHRLSDRLRDIGYGFANAISPYAVISPRASTGCGVAVMAGAVVNACTAIGDGCIINTNCSVDHDNSIGAYCHIAPGVTLCGTVTIGAESFVGAGARVIDGITIGAKTMIGAGAAVVRDIPGGCTAVGVPARKIK